MKTTICRVFAVILLLSIVPAICVFGNPHGFSAWNRILLGFFIDGIMIFASVLLAFIIVLIVAPEDVIEKVEDFFDWFKPVFIFLKQFFCIHDYKMTEEAKKIPPLDCEGVETREFQCKKCGKIIFQSQYICM